jgi:hypothetical protein
MSTRRRVPHRSKCIDPTVWERNDIRRALAVRDIGAVYRLLQRFGVAQRRIAALDGLPQVGYGQRPHRGDVRGTGRP